MTLQADTSIAKQGAPTAAVARAERDARSVGVPFAALLAI